jgi:hypothetical protein
MEPNIATLSRQDVTIKTGSGTYQGKVGMIEESGIWITLAPGRPSPDGAPQTMNLKMFFPFAQMHWLAVAGK